VGLVIGLNVHWQTAWFAIFEAGIPAAIVGGLLGTIAALIITGARRIARRDTPSD
jgi:prolipoprotein diacylglyceryltransferase